MLPSGCIVAASGTYRVCIVSVSSNVRSLATIAIHARYGTRYKGDTHSAFSEGRAGGPYRVQPYRVCIGVYRDSPELARYTCLDVYRTRRIVSVSRQPRTGPIHTSRCVSATAYRKCIVSVSCLFLGHVSVYVSSHVSYCIEISIQYRTISRSHAYR